MKIVHLSAFERVGGAAIAARRIHSALCSAGLDSRLLVQFSSGAPSETTVAPQGKIEKALALLGDTLDPLPLIPYRRPTGSVFSCNWVPSGAAKRTLALGPDLVHLHWIGAAMLSTRQLRRFDVPVVWTLHDMWPLTGGCHYSGACEGYLNECGCCPQLDSKRPADLSRWSMRRKRKSWHDLPMTLVAPSQWLAECARRSSLFEGRDIRMIRNGLDLDIWRPLDKSLARSSLGLPDGPILMFSAAGGLSAPYKGGNDMLNILESLHADGHRFTLVLMGTDSLPEGYRPGFPVHCLGKLHDDVSRVLVYSAADLTLHSAVADNLPNGIVESMACGTPVAGYRIGGVPEMITDRENGVLAPPGNRQAFADAVAWYLSNADRQAMSVAARGRAESEYAQELAAGAYTNLYAELLGS